MSMWLGRFALIAQRNSFINATRAKQASPAMLSVSRFVLRSLARRRPGVDFAPDLDKQIDDLISHAALVNPTAEEIAFAEDLEEQAARTLAGIRRWRKPTPFRIDTKERRLAFDRRQARHSGNTRPRCLGNRQPHRCPGAGPSLR